MNLFDDIVRDDSPARNAEGLYPFLNRSSWPVSERARVLCEKWFSSYPKGSRNDLYRRFTSLKDDEHRGAYFELLLHEVLVQLGATLAVHPSVPGTTKNPDFLVDLGDTPFYLEAMVSHAKEADFGDSRTFDTVCDWIDDMDIPDHVVHIIFSNAPTRQPSRRSIRAQIMRLISLSEGETTPQQLVADGYHELACGLMSIDDAYARVWLSPRSNGERAAKERDNVIRSAGGEMQDVALKWRENLRRKARDKELEQYDLPCVIAIDVIDGFARIGDKGSQAVYGSARGSEWQDGLWTNEVESSWRDKLVAVWMFNYAEPVQASPSGSEDCLLFSPTIHQPPLTALALFNHIKREAGELTWFDGLELDELLEVPYIPYEDLRRSKSLVR